VTRRPIIIAHRGACGHRPEHTLQAYAEAIKQNADFIEPDLVVTSDKVLVARHDNALATVKIDANQNIVVGKDNKPLVVEETTNVADLPEFQDRLTVKTLDGVPIGGWFVEDFSIDEIKRLRARERMPDVRPGNVEFNDRFEIPTLSEVIRLVKNTEAHTRKRIGIYPETKHPTYFAQEGRFLHGERIECCIGQLLVQTLAEEQFTESDRVFIQSFEFANLIELKKEILPQHQLTFPLIQLYGESGDPSDETPPSPSSFSRPYDMVYNVLHHHDLKKLYGELPDLVEGGITASTGYAELLADNVLKFISGEYAAGIGPWKERLLLDRDLHPGLQSALDLGLEVHPYTLRAEERFLRRDDEGKPMGIEEEVVRMLGLGVTGFFIDQPYAGWLARQRFLKDSG